MAQPSRPTTYPPLIDQGIVLTGSTASGKSSVALQLADRLGGEILSVDSIAVYRYMDIGTAKPSQADRNRQPHHLIDLAEPDQEFSVAQYLDETHRRVAEINRRGKLPIFVGGTPMFLKAILRGFDPGPPPDWDFRNAVEKDLERFGAEALRVRLDQVDPLSAARIAPGDTRRMIRALEVSMQTGMPMSHRQVQFDRNRDQESCSVFALKYPRPKLHERINARVKSMFEIGLIDEVRWLLDRYGALSRTASQAVGYREVIEWIAEEGPVDDLIDLVATHTRQLAKRQETWFRSFSEITTIEIDRFEQDALVRSLLERIERRH